MDIFMEMVDKALADAPVIIFGIFAMVIVIASHPESEDWIVRLLRHQK